MLALTAKEVGAAKGTEAGVVARRRGQVRGLLLLLLLRLGLSLLV